MKKKLAIILILALCFNMAGCTSVVLSEELEGTWTGYTYMSYKKLEYTWLYETIWGFKSEIGIPVTITFSNDGRVVIEIVDDEITEEALDSLRDELEAALLESFHEQATEMGWNQEETDEAYEAEFGMSCSEYAEEVVEDIDLEGMYIGVIYEGTYVINDEKMIIEIDGNKLDVEIKGDTLIIIDADDDDELEALLGALPIELERSN